MSAGWEHFEVEADVGVRGWGDTRAAAFAQTTLGVFALLVEPAEVDAREQREVRAQADGPESLLVAWIDECLYVHDIEKSRAFYKDFLGFDEPYSIHDPDGKLHLTWIKINDEQTIELFPEKEAGSDRLYHIALITDAVAMREYLDAKGVQVPGKVPKGKIGNSNYFVKDPDGHFVEMVRYEPDGWTVVNKGKFMPDTRISTRMPHVGILVGDLDAAKRFYENVLGFKEI